MKKPQDIDIYVLETSRDIRIIDLGIGDNIPKKAYTLKIFPIYKEDKREQTLEKANAYALDIINQVCNAYNS